MAETTAIEWADATINLWWGCTKVSPGCRECYAEAWARRWGKDLWGDGAARERKKGAVATAKKLDRQAAAEQRTIRVFSASMSDWLDPAVPASWLAELLGLIFETPHLTWMLLTKRPELWRERMEVVLASGLPPNVAAKIGKDLAGSWLLDGRAPRGVWIGTTVEDQQRADERIPALLEIPARVRFLSCEPLLGPVHLEPWLSREHEPTEDYAPIHGIDWIITGGESGPGARPMHPAWARSMRDQAQAAGVTFFFKQWGEWAPCVPGDEPGAEWVGGDGRVLQRWSTGDRGADPGRWHPEGDVLMHRVGKKLAGRALDGRTWDEFPGGAR